MEELENGKRSNLRPTKWSCTPLEGLKWISFLQARDDTPETFKEVNDFQNRMKVMTAFMNNCDLTTNDTDGPCNWDMKFRKRNFIHRLEMRDEKWTDVVDLFSERDYAIDFIVLIDLVSTSLFFLKNNYLWYPQKLA